MTGMDRFDDKQRRSLRRRHPIARDLRTPKYRQRIEKGRPPKQPPEIELDWEED